MCSNFNKFHIQKPNFKINLLSINCDYWHYMSYIIYMPIDMSNRFFVIIHNICVTTLDIFGYS